MNLRAIKRNMTEIDLGNGHRVLFSYNTPVAESFVTPEGRIYRMTSQKWSATTSRHIKAWVPIDGATLLPQSYFDDLIAVTSLESEGC